MNTTDPFDVLQALAPTAPSDDEVLVRARASCERAITGTSPARPTRRGRWLAVAAAAGAVTIGAALWQGSGQSAVASWTSTPTVATTAQVAAAQGRCDAVLALTVEMGAANAAKPGYHLPTPSAADLAGRTAQLAEQRGEFTFVLSTNNAWAAGCLVAPQVSEDLSEAGLVDLSMHTAALGPQDVDFLSAADEATTDGAHWARVAYGRVGAQVTSVDVATVGGPVVHATVAHGYWTAWWPTLGDEKVLDAQITVGLANGTRVAAGTLDALNNDVRVRR